MAQNTRDLTEEIWADIPDFPQYEVSNYGRIYNTRFELDMSLNPNNFGHMKVTLRNHRGERLTRSVALLVAEAFVEKPNELCDQIILLDGDLANVKADNIAWRPRWFAWKYTRQLKTVQPPYYLNLPVVDLTINQEFASIVTAAHILGLLYEDVWRSTYTGDPTFPTGSIFEVTERV